MRDEQLQRYLAEHYYSGAKSDAILAKYGDAKKKKKKRSQAETPSAADAMTIRDASSVYFGAADEEDEEMPEPTGPVVTESAPSSKSQHSGWTSVRAPAPVSEPKPVPEPAPAPAPASEPVPEAASEPVPEAAPETAPETAPKTAPAPKAGLMTREQLRAQREAREASERAMTPVDEPSAPPTETVYRDAQGRRIDMAEEEARLKAEEDERARKEQERSQWNRGLVQRRAEAQQRAELAAVQDEGVTKYVRQLTQVCGRCTVERITTRTGTLGRSRAWFSHKACEPTRDAAALRRSSATAQPLRNPAGLPMGRR